MFKTNTGYFPGINNPKLNVKLVNTINSMKSTSSHINLILKHIKESEKNRKIN
jgi:hypothetical protein